MEKRNGILEGDERHPQKQRAFRQTKSCVHLNFVTRRYLTTTVCTISTSFFDKNAASFLSQNFFRKMNDEAPARVLSHVCSPLAISTSVADKQTIRLLIGMVDLSETTTAKRLLSTTHFSDKTEIVMEAIPFDIKSPEDIVPLATRPIDVVVVFVPLDIQLLDNMVLQMTNRCGARVVLGNILFVSEDSSVVQKHVSNLLSDVEETMVHVALPTNTNSILTAICQIMVLRSDKTRSGHHLHLAGLEAFLAVDHPLAVIAEANRLIQENNFQWRQAEQTLRDAYTNHTDWPIQLKCEFEEQLAIAVHRQCTEDSTAESVRLFEDVLDVQLKKWGAEGFCHPSNQNL